MILLLVNTDTKSRPPIRNVETPVSYTKNSVLRYVSFTNWPYARQTDLKLIVVIVMLTRLCHGKRVGKSCLFVTPTDTPRHKQVGKKYLGIHVTV